MIAEIPHFLDWGRFAENEWDNVMRQFADGGNHEFVVYDRWCLLLALDPKFLKRLKALHNSGYSRMVGSHAPFGGQFDLLSFDPEFIPIARHIHLRLMDILAGEFGIDTYTMHPLNDFTFSGDEKDAIRKLEQMLPPLLKTAEKNHIVIAMENGIQPIDQPDVLPRLVEHFNSPYLGCCCDIGHLNMVAHRRGLDLMTCLEMMYPQIVVSHLHDNDGVADRHWVAGLGSIDWPRIMPVLAKAPRLRSLQDEGIYSVLPVDEICTRINRLRDYAGNRCI